jgi:hypothetical protein
VQGDVPGVVKMDVRVVEFDVAKPVVLDANHERDRGETSRRNAEQDGIAGGRRHDPLARTRAVASTIGRESRGV